MPCLPPAHPPNITAAIYPWRIGGKLHLTFIAKAAYNWAHGGVMTNAPPESIRTADETHGKVPTRSVAFSAENAPYLRACDVLFCGSVHIASGVPAPTFAARIGLFSDGKPILDKTIHVVGDRPAGTTPTPFLTMPLVYERAFGGAGLENPVGTETPNILHPNDPRKPIGFGAISRYWPVRKKLISAEERSQLYKSEPSLSENHPWTYHQAAPADQQVPYLRGGEWIVLDGLHKTLPRVQTQLPLHSAAACLRTNGQPQVELPMVADMLILDGDRQMAHVVYRCQTPFPFASEALSTLQTAVAFVDVHASPPWEDLFAQSPASLPHLPPQRQSRLPVAMKRWHFQQTLLFQKPL
ncbi:MAG: DUF2169 domain-containing protein [Polyangiaceae bacterium]|nr:DUF2169 domain-containing protein [Polyangiaceae bacterium]